MLAHKKTAPFLPLPAFGGIGHPLRLLLFCPKQLDRHSRLQELLFEIFHRLRKKILHIKEKICKIFVHTCWLRLAMLLVFSASSRDSPRAWKDAKSLHGSEAKRQRGKWRLAKRGQEHLVKKRSRKARPAASRETASRENRTYGSCHDELSPQHAQLLATCGRGVI